MKNGFNHLLFDSDPDFSICPCDCHFHIKHHNGVDIELCEGIPDTVTIPLEVCIWCDLDDIIFYVTEEAPTTSTIGSVGTKCFNLWDMRSWTCTAVTTSGTFLYTWEEDEQFTARDEGEILIPMASNYYEDKTYKMTIYNTRWEQLDERSYQAASPFKFDIGEDLLAILKRGTYRYQIDLISSANAPMMRMADSSNSAILVR